METKKFLQINEVILSNNTILDTRVIGDNLYIKNKEKLSVLVETIQDIYFDHTYYLDALDMYKNQLIFMCVDEVKKEIIFKNEDNIKSKIKIKKEIKNIFMFFIHGYAIILYKDNSLAVYNIKLNKIISNVLLEEDFIDMFKSFSTSELVFISKNKISFFNIKTVKISRQIDIEQNDYIDISIKDNNVYFIYKDKIKIITKDNKELNIDINIDDDVVQVFTNIHQKEIIFITKSNTIYFYHLESNSIFKTLTYDNKIEAVRFIASDIYVISKNKILKIDTTQGALEFEKHLVLHETDQAFNILEDNPFLLLDEMFFKLLRSLWTEIYNKISNNLLMNKPDKAKDLCGRFDLIHTFKQDFDDIMGLCDVFKNLGQALRTINYSDVFQLIEENKSLKQTPIGKKVLIDWEQSFERFIFSLLKNKFDKTNKEYKALQKYLNVYKKKEIIVFAIEHQNVILSAIQAFKNKKYALYTNLLEKYKTLNELPITKRIEAIAQNIYLKTLSLIKHNKLNEALELVETLQSFSKYKEKSLLLKEKINVYLGFETSFKKSNVDRCRMFVEQYTEHFENTPYYLKLIIVDLRKIESSLTFIDNNDFNNSYLILQEFFKSQIWSSKIRCMMIRYYIQQYKFQQYEISIRGQKIYIDKFYKLFGYVDEVFPKLDDIDYNTQSSTKDVLVNYPKRLL